LSLAATAAAAQTPQPFPQPGTQKTSPALPAPLPAKPAEPAKPRSDGGPSDAELGAPIYPSAVFLTSYDAGRGQRFYIFGATVPYADLVGYYKTVLKTKGDELFDQPPTHQFETARFRDETMAFPPSVTIKDYSAGGSAGYPNPKADATPARFPTVIQIVALPRP
jgi:hypothetical protein